MQFASISFDGSIAEIAMALASGSALYLACGDAALPGAELIELLRAGRITHAKLPPSALGALSHVDLPDLRVLMVGGEVCPTRLVADWAPGRQFWNLYGPTEVTVQAMAHKCRADEKRSTPIGRPIANTQVYVLDGVGEPVPVGAVELYRGAGGAGVLESAGVDGGEEQLRN